jgi:transcriptional regulator with XRE-family HTH domain
MNVIAYNLRRLREAAGLSQQALGEAAGLASNAHVSHIESGRIDDPNTKTLRSLARALGVELSELFVEPAEPEASTGPEAA